MAIIPRLIVPAATLPISLAQAKSNMRVDHDEDNDLITSYINAAVALLDGPEGKLGKAIEPQTWEISLDQFPESEIRLPVGPLVSVTSVKYTSSDDGSELTVSSDDYEIDDRSYEGWVVPVTGIPWPTPMTTVNAVRVRWVAGRGADAAVKQAILLLVGHWYRMREAVGENVEEVPLGVEALIARRKHIVMA